MSKKGGPSAGDYNNAANKMWNQSNQAIDKQTQSNRPDQQTAWGSTSWSQDPNGNWTQNQSLNPQLQGLMDTAIGRQQQGVDYSSLPGLDSGAGARDQAIQGAYSQATSRLDPQWQQNQTALQTQLANQGLSAGDSAYDQQMANFGRQKNDAYSSAMNGAIAQGTQAGSALFNQSLQGRQEMLGEANQQMNQPLQGFNSLLAGSGQMSMPGFQGAGAATPGNYLGAMNGAAQSQANQNQFYGSMFQGLGGMGLAGAKLW